MYLLYTNGVIFLDTKEKVEGDILSFYNSGQLIMNINDISEVEEHLLIFQTLIDNVEDSLVILFRVGAEVNFNEVLNNDQISFKPGTRYSAEHHRVYVDTSENSTWDSSPGRIDVAVVYTEITQDLDACINDLNSRDVKKIFLVSNTGE
jgi:hypothetical protein